MIIFDHRRKCGGTSIRRQLARHFNWTAYYSNLQQTGIVDPSRPIELTFGHDIFARISKRPLTDFYFTVIRNPVDIVYSGARATWRGMQTADEGWPLDDIIKRRVDQVLTEDSKLAWIWRTKDHFRGFDPDRYHFVGIQELMNETCLELSALLGKRIDHQTKYNASTYQHSHYKRLELEAFFREEIAIWKQCYAQLAGRYRK